MASTWSLAMLASAVALGACGNNESRASPPPSRMSPKLAETDAGTALDQSPSSPTMPGGWRDLRWGMSEKQVATIIKRGKWARGSKPWKKGPGPDGLTVLAPDGRFFIVDHELRFESWSSCGLEGASCVQTWFLDGKLVEVVAQAPRDIERNAFERRATESYGAEPRRLRVGLIRPQGGHLKEGTRMDYNIAPERELLLWGGPAATAVLYDSLRDDRPQVVVWDREAMPLIWSALLEKEAGDKAAADRDRKRREDATRF